MLVQDPIQRAIALPIEQPAQKKTEAADAE